MAIMPAHVRSAFPALTVSRGSLERRARTLVAHWRETGTRPDWQLEIWDNACTLHDEFYATTGTARAILASLPCPELHEPDAA